MVKLMRISDNCTAALDNKILYNGFDIHLIVCLCVVVAFCVLCTSIHTHVLNYLQSTVRYLQNCVPKPHILTYKGLHSTVAT